MRAASAASARTRRARPRWPPRRGPPRSARRGSRSSPPPARPPRRAARAGRARRRGRRRRAARAAAPGRRRAGPCATASRALRASSLPRPSRLTAIVAFAPGRVNRVAVRNSRSSSQLPRRAGVAAVDGGQRRGVRAAQDRRPRGAAGGRQPHVVAAARCRRGGRSARMHGRVGARAGGPDPGPQRAAVRRGACATSRSAVVSVPTISSVCASNSASRTVVGGAPRRQPQPRPCAGASARIAPTSASAAPPLALQLDAELARGLADLAGDRLGAVLRVGAERVGLLRA